MTRKQLLTLLAVLLAFANGVFATSFFNLPRQQTIATSFVAIGLLALAIAVSAAWKPQQTN